MKIYSKKGKKSSAEAENSQPNGNFSSKSPTFGLGQIRFGKFSTNLSAHTLVL